MVIMFYNVVVMLTRQFFFTDSDFVCEGENGCLIAPDTDLLIM